MVPGEACSHHKNAHPTDEGGNVAHVGEAIPGKDIGFRLQLTVILTKPGPVLPLRQQLGHCYFVKDTHPYPLHTCCLQINGYFRKRLNL